MTVMMKNSFTKSISLETLSCHLYHYAGNNPICYIDPDGKSETEETSLGRRIHAEILNRYKLQHPNEDVVGNYKSMSSVLFLLNEIDKGLGKTDIGLKPDIWNVTTGDIYEIKPFAEGEDIAEGQAGLYMLLLMKYGHYNVRLGDQNDLGVKGVFSIDDKLVFYESPKNGVILYNYITLKDFKRIEYTKNLILAISLTTLLYFGYGNIPRIPFPALSPGF